MFGIQSETSLLISSEKLSSLATKKWGGGGGGGGGGGDVGPKAAPEYHTIATCTINHN